MRQWIRSLCADAWPTLCSHRTDTRSKAADFFRRQNATVNGWRYKSDAKENQNAGFRVDADSQRNRVARLSEKNGRVFPSKSTLSSNPLDISHLAFGTFGPPRASNNTEGGQNFDENAFAADQGNSRSGFSENAAPSDLDACGNRYFAGLFCARVDRGGIDFWNGVRGDILVRRALLHAGKRLGVRSRVGRNWSSSNCDIRATRLRRARIRWQRRDGVNQ